MKDLTATQTLLAIFPIIFVLLALIAAILVFGKSGIFELRGRAATVKVVPSIVTLPSPAGKPSPEYACSELYDPVCGVNGLTYGSRCEAGVASITVAYQGECVPVLLPTITE